MITWKLPPQNPRVSRFVEAYWFIHKAPEDQSNDFPKLYPDVSAQLVLAADDYRYEYISGQHRQTGVSSHCILPHSQTFTMDHSKAFTIIGVKIRPGMHSQLGELIAAAKLNLISALSEKAPDGATIRRWLDLAHATESTVQELDSWLANIATQSISSTPQALVQQTIRLLPDNTCSDLGYKLATSQRTLERHFKAQTLMTLKQFQSALRAEKLLEYLSTNEDKHPDWADISQHFGFADQPHFIREMKQLIGVTPNSYWRAKDLTIDVYGDFHEHAVLI